MNPTVLTFLVLGGALVLIGVRLWSHYRGPFPEGEEWSPAKQIIFEVTQERKQRAATFAMILGLVILWSNVFTLVLPRLSPYLKPFLSTAETSEVREQNSVPPPPKQNAAKKAAAPNDRLPAPPLVRDIDRS